MRLPLRSALVSALLALAACAVDRGGSQGLYDGLDWLAPGQTTEAEVRERLGPPEFLRESASGIRYLTYQAYAIARYGILHNDSTVVVFRVEAGKVQQVQEGSFF